MYCRNCGKNINENAEICVGCGCRPYLGNAFCQNCGSMTNENQELCIKCGVLLTKNNNINNGRKINYDFSTLERYYQEEFTKMRNDSNYKGKFNWAAFFFGGLWVLFKGMLLPALILLVLGCGVSFFTLGIGTLILWIIIGFRGNYLYYNYYTKNEIKLL